ncbi:LAQU0S04e09604g1_1 [Lachancea quebecensis]|uniref:LAQU0S04e09604g1_1 n=1 Tax=Lachancea quebecensis TaxID=1654605 RepID=A0A0P1KQ39_9SACH|nr:LAQU0S04e09604g1_1 [Lachancea quebecensis]
MNNIIQCFEYRRSNQELLDFLRYDRPCSSSVFSLGRINNEKLAQLIQATLVLKQEFAENCGSTTISAKLFELANEQLKLMNRLSEGETVWITAPLHASAAQLLRVGTQLDKMASEQRDIDKKKKKKLRGDLEEERFLEKCVRTIHTSFKLCLNDRNPNTRENKKWGVYFFTNLELSIYKRLHNRDMVRNLVKVLESRVQELPTPENALQSHKAQLVTYYYYMAEFYGCQDSNFVRGFEFARKAWLNSRLEGGAQEDMIVMLLVPFAILARKWYPNIQELAERYPRVAQLYAPVIQCLRNGDLKSFETWLRQNEAAMLRRNLYVALVLIRELVLIKLLKLSFRFYGSRSIVPLNLVTAALLKSRTHKGIKTVTDEQLDETECTLANLISKDYIKGYLSHSNRALVVSKTNAFPRLVHAST